MFMLVCRAAWCQLFKFDLISALSNSIFDIIGLARTSQEYHVRFLRTDTNYNFRINFIKMLFNILKIKSIFGDFVIRYRFSMLFDACLSILRNRFGFTFYVDSTYWNIVQHYSWYALVRCMIQSAFNHAHCKYLQHSEGI